MASSNTPRRRSSVRRPSIPDERLGPLISSKPAAPGGVFNLVFVGAGHINFGGHTGPWDHSFRLEHKLGPRLKVVAIIDPATSVAQAVLDRKRNSFVVSAYAETRICASLDEFVETMKEEDRPHAFIVGSPPAFRGSIKPGRDFEVQVLRHFPNNTPAMFLEKPLSTDTPEEAGKVARMLVDSRTILSVGYFLRYLKGLLVFIFSGSPHPLTTLAVEVVQTMRKILEDNNLEVVATIARYASSYAFSTKHAWWMKSKDCGPIVEQATHFVDLSRYFGGEVDLASVQAQQLDWDEPAGELSVVPVDEKSVEPADRIPRVTSACWFVFLSSHKNARQSLTGHGPSFAGNTRTLK
ncbi:hypothetical protein JCM1841_003360 [Sporobolomyces salmonicolor]